MAASFNGSTHIRCTFSAVAAYPYTLYMRAQSASATTANCAFEFGSPGADDDMHSFYFRGDIASDPIQFRRTGPSASSGSFNSSSGYATNTWVDVVGVAAAGNDARLYMNNEKTTGTTNVNFANGNLVIGAHIALNSVFDRLNGLVAACAVWDAALTDDEAASLYRGFSPRRIRPQSLKFYAPLVRDRHDVRGGVTLTVTGTGAVDAHPRIYGL